MPLMTQEARALEMVARFGSIRNAAEHMNAAPSAVNRQIRNLAARVTEDLWPGFKARAMAACQAPFRAIARDPADGPVADCESRLPGAVACLMDDFEACIAHSAMPVTHRRAM